MHESSLSALTRAAVWANDGQRIGRVVDISVGVSDAAPRLRQLVVQARNRSKATVPWSRVESCDGQAIRLGMSGKDIADHTVVAPRGSSRIPLADDELLLVRDVLDSQVVDLANRRLTRVAEVLVDLESAHEVSGVDLGMGALLCRLGLGTVGRRLPPTRVEWHQLRLASVHGHRVQLATDAAALDRLDALMLAELVARLATAPALDVLRSVGYSRSVGVLDVSHPIHQRRLMHAMSPEEAHRVVDEAPPALADSLGRLHRRTAGRRMLRTAGWQLHRPKAKP